MSFISYILQIFRLLLTLPQQAVMPVVVEREREHFDFAQWTHSTGSMQEFSGLSRQAQDTILQLLPV